MRSRLPLAAARRRAVSAAVSAVLVAGCAATALAGPPALPAFASDGGPPASREAGSTLIAASGMAPGDTVRGALALTNPRDQRARLSLSVAATDRPGPYGGDLSERLRLVVRSRGGSVLYSGPLPTADVALGSLRRDERQRYSLSVTFPDGGRAGSDSTGDNAYQGSSSSLDFRWRLN